MITSMAASAARDGSAPLLCAIDTIMECDATGQCQRYTALPHPDFPPFPRRLILQGGENGRGWSAAISEDTGRLTAGIVADDFSFAVSGACTTP
jgi:hypothetical protein